MVEHVQTTQVQGDASLHDFSAIGLICGTGLVQPRKLPKHTGQLIQHPQPDRSAWVESFMSRPGSEVSEEEQAHPRHPPKDQKRTTWIAGEQVQAGCSTSMASGEDACQPQFREQDHGDPLSPSHAWCILSRSAHQASKPRVKYGHIIISTDLELDLHLLLQNPVIRPS
eukprot:s1380_g9.t1